MVARLIQCNTQYTSPKKKEQVKSDLFWNAGNSSLPIVLQLLVNYDFSKHNGPASAPLILQLTAPNKLPIFKFLKRASFF